MSGPVVVKVGGSLLGRAELVSWLRAYLAGLRPVALLVGGGPTTDAVRTLDRIHGLGEEMAHDLALRALTVNALALAHLLATGPLTATLAEVWSRDVAVLDAWALLRALEETGPVLPHTWAATSDSVALVLAGSLGARELQLVKSVGPAGPLDAGGIHPPDIVDPCFADLWRQWPSLVVRVEPV